MSAGASSSNGGGGAGVSADTVALRSMLMSFRVAELAQLLDFAGKNAKGKKSDLQTRALSVLAENKKEYNAKIGELSNAMFKSIGSAQSVNPYSANYKSKNGKADEDDDGLPPALPIAAAGKKTNKTAPPPARTSARKANSSSKKGGGGKKRKDESDTDDDYEESEEEDDDESEDDFEGGEDDGDDDDEEEEVLSSDYSPSSEEERTPSPEPVKIKRPPPTTSRSMRTSTRELSKASLAAAAAAKEPPPLPPAASKKKSTSPQKGGSKTATPSAGNRRRTAAEAIAASSAQQRRSAGAASSSSVGSRSKVVVTTAGLSSATNSLSSARAGSGSSTTTPSLVQVEDSAPIYPQYHRNNSIVSQAYRAGYFASQSMRQSAAPKPAAASSPANTTTPSASTTVGGRGFTYENPRTSHNPGLMYPTFPDVKLRRLPFYRLMATLMQPCSLQPSGSARFQEQKFSFFLSPTQVENVERGTYRDSATGRFEHKFQVQLRFSLLETSCEQDDNFPSSICVKVNNKMQPLPNPIPTNKPGVEPKRPPKPINITPLCRLSATMANYLDISWAVDYGRGYTVSVYFVERLNSNDLMKQLKQRGIRHPDFTKATIKEKLNDKDADVATMSCKVTLACPLGKMRMNWPCRATTCDHLQCFDASLFLMMNERKPKWLCPVCNKLAFFDNLLLDGFFKEVLGSSRLPSDDHEIVLHNDGSWDPLPAKRDPNSTSSPSPPASPKPNIKPDPGVETFSVDDDSSDGNGGGSGNGAVKSDHAGSAAAAATEAQKRSIDCITLDSDDDDGQLSAALQASKKARTTDPPASSQSLAGSSAPPTGGTIQQQQQPQQQSSSRPPLPPAQPPSPTIICLDDD